MKVLTCLLTAIIVSTVSICQAQGVEETKLQPEAVIKNYFDGWARKDWNQVSRQLAQGFTFTSAAPDDHISIEDFKEKCWPQAQHIQRFEFPEIIGDMKRAFAIVHVVTNDNRVIRNVEYFTFVDGKIKAIEVFFGGSGYGFPTNIKK